DIEIQRLMMRALEIAGARDVFLDIGHVGIFRSLVRRARVDRDVEAELFRAMQAKDLPGIRELIRKLPAPLREGLAALPELYGGPEVLEEAARRLPRHPEIEAALGNLRALSEQLRDVAHLRCFDLAELRGYHYHSGVVFAAYAQGQPYAIALGGRYDEVGKSFGRARPATGFSMDLRELAAFSRSDAAETVCVCAPYAPDDAVLQRRIAALRARGTPVLVALPGHDGEHGESKCDRRLVKRAGKWLIEKMAPVGRRRA
ncbi:MAG: ATP phosphoribosyltransferase regulatory subunit, partial [Vulcanimicrobiaceae bacterium]